MGKKSGGGGGAGGKKSGHGATNTAPGVPNASTGEKRGKNSQNLGTNPTPTQGGQFSRQSAGVGSRAGGIRDDGTPAGPTARELVAGASWTGKLPVNIFNEHAQKQGWERVEYTWQKSNKGFFPTVVVRYKNNRSQQIEEVQFTPPPQLGNYQATPVEARNYGATYALNRVCSMKNIHLMLPPGHQAYWKQFEAVRKEEIKAGKGWMYEADPFAAQRERIAAQEKEVKQKEAKEEAKKKERNHPKGMNLMKGWEHVANVEMTKQMRIQVEELARKYHVWNPTRIKMSSETKENVVKDLTMIGFRKSHVEEACEWTKDIKECLEWLLVHVPEDDLPQRFLPSNYTVGISIIGPNEPIATTRAAERLSEAGYSIDICREALTLHKGDEALAAERLMHMLISKDHSYSPLEANLVSFEEGEPWEEEQRSYEAIWGIEAAPEVGGIELKFKRDSPTVSTVLLELDPPLPKHLKPSTPNNLYVKLRKPVNNYPSSVPVITIHSGPGQPKLPAHIRLSIIRQAATYAQEECSGEQMVFNIVNWLQSNVARIIENPGRLRDVAGAITQLEFPGNRVERKRKGMHPSAARESPKALPSDISIRLLMHHKKKLTSAVIQKMINSRKMLPAWDKREEIVNAVNNSQVTIITGETGSGKSTQAIQFVLDDLIERRMGGFANIFCTQPRRLSALGLADRVAEERCCALGEEVGYIIKGDSKHKAGVTRITFVTTGVLLRRLQMGRIGSEECGQWAGLDEISHVFVDEVHERSLDTDFLLVLLRNALSARKDLKIVLMSATLDANAFAEYFKNGPCSSEVRVSIVNIEGRTFPVDDIYLDEVIRRTDFQTIHHRNSSDNPSSDGEGLHAPVSSIIRTMGDRINYALIAQTVRHIDEKLGTRLGGILIFLPGSMEIIRTLDAVNNLPKASFRFHALPLHASLLPSQQKLVFPPAPPGKRKVIAATNVAETSITIEDIVAVIDTGRVKETSYDVQFDTARLTETWASRAACKQRKGRAGRVRAGECYKLFTKSFEQNKMSEQSEPEIKRVPLQQTCLTIKGMGIENVKTFLTNAKTPPETTAIEGALNMLEKMGALQGGELTALGRHMSVIPTDLKSSKLLVYGSIFGILERSLIIASILSSKSPFYSPVDKRDESRAARSRFRGAHGDLLADMFAFEQWYDRRYIQKQSPTETKIWCETHFLSHHTLLDILSNKIQLLDSLRESGFLPYWYRYRDSGERDSSSELDTYLNRHCDSLPLLKALVLAAFTPQVARIQFPQKKFFASSSGAVELDPEAKTIKYFTNDVGRVFLHPSSTLFSIQNYSSNAAFLAYFVKGATGKAVTATAAAEDKNYPQEGGGKVFLRDVIPVNPYSVLFFGGELGIDRWGRGIIIDGWMRIKGWGRIGVLVNMVRKLLDRVIARGIEDPANFEEGMSRLRIDTDAWDGKKDGEEEVLAGQVGDMERQVIEVVRKLVELDGMDR